VGVEEVDSGTAQSSTMELVDNIVVQQNKPPQLDWYRVYPQGNRFWYLIASLKPVLAPLNSLTIFKRKLVQKTMRVTSQLFNV
jgi:hypothetical protein